MHALTLYFLPLLITGIWFIHNISICAVFSDQFTQDADYYKRRSFWGGKNQIFFGCFFSGRIALSRLILLKSCSLVLCKKKHRPFGSVQLAFVIKWVLIYDDRVLLGLVKRWQNRCEQSRMSYVRWWLIMRAGLCSQSATRRGSAFLGVDLFLVADVFQSTQCSHSEFYSLAHIRLVSLWIWLLEHLYVGIH